MITFVRVSYVSQQGYLMTYYIQSNCNRASAGAQPTCYSYNVICIVRYPNSVSISDSDDFDLMKDGDGSLMGGMLSRISTQEWRWREASYDYDKRFYGHCNTTTDIKEVNFFGRLEQKRYFS